MTSKPGAVHILQKAPSLCPRKMVLIFLYSQRPSCVPELLSSLPESVPNTAASASLPSLSSQLSNDYCDFAVWEHHAFWPRFARIPAAVGTALFGSIKTPDLVVYDHVDLAVLHAVIPRLKSVPYAVFLHGIEVWKPLVGRRREALLGANLLLVNSATTEAEARGFNPWLPKVEVTWLGVERQNEIADVGSNPPDRSDCRPHG